MRWAVVADVALVYLRDTPSDRGLVAIARDNWQGATLPRWLLAGDGPELVYTPKFVATPALKVTPDALRLGGAGPAVGIWRLA
jgi:alpha-glucosidase